MTKLFSKEDEEYLEYYLYCGEESYDSAAEFLGVTNRQLIKKLNKMRKKDKSLGYVCRPFEDWEIKYIKTNYKNISTELMSEVLNRSRDAIIAKANSLGISKLKRIGDYDEDIRSLAEQGYTRAGIARELSLKPKSVGDYINRNHIKCRQADRSEMGGYFRELEQARNNEMKEKYNR